MQLVRILVIAHRNNSNKNTIFDHIEGDWRLLKMDDSALYETHLFIDFWKMRGLLRNSLEF